MFALNAAEDPDPCYLFALALLGTVHVFVVLCRMCGMCGMCNKGMVLGKGMLWYQIVSNSVCVYLSVLLACVCIFFMFYLCLLFFDHFCLPFFQFNAYFHFLG